MKIKPLARPGFTMFNNYVLDYFMPNLSANGWKVLCVAIRRTIGWVDEDTESGRKEQDRISYSQFLEATGIGSSATLSRAIQECLDKRYLLRKRSADHEQGYDYCLPVLEFASEAYYERKEQEWHREVTEQQAKTCYIQQRRREFASMRAQLALLLIHRDGYQCRHCGTQDDLTIDHIVPLSEGGSDDPDNLQLLCRGCNSQKGNRSR